MNRRHLLQAMALSATGLWLPGTAFSKQSWDPSGSRLTRILDVRVWTAPDHTRVVYDLDGRVDHTLFHLPRPDRMVVDLKHSRWQVDPARLNLSDAVIRRFRTGSPAKGTIRTVFELTQEVRANSFVLPAAGNKGPRLVVDLIRKSGDGAPARTAKSTSGRRHGRSRRDAVVVIDPGHGGEDPGAVGAGGTMEKDIALAVGRRLKRHIDRLPGFKAHLTRDGDYFVSLRKRVSSARKHDADLFVSLHADAFHIPSAKGASVYTLSERGKPSPDRAIRNLVRRENSADLIGGVNLQQFSDPEVQGILMDLSQRDSLNRALKYGHKLLTSLKKVPSLDLHFREVKQAGFAVLKAPDMPSVLVEMAFLTNREEERLLGRRSYQEALAKALAKGTEHFVRSSRLA